MNLGQLSRLIRGGIQFPQFTSSAAATSPENIDITGTVTTNQTCNYTVSGADAALVSLVGANWTVTKRDFEDPTHGPTYTWNFVATNPVSGAVSSQAFVLTITDVLEITLEVYPTSPTAGTVI